MAEEKKEESPEKEQADGAAAEGAEAAPSGGRKKLILIAVAAVVLLAGAGAGLYFSGILGGKDSGEETGAEAAAGEHGESKKAEAGGHGKSSGHGGEKGKTKTASSSGAYFLQIPNMLVNLSTTDGPPRYLRLSVQLELANEADIQSVESVMPRVVDEFQTYLRELRVKDLRGSAGIYRLQMELLSRVNAAAYPTEVKDVLFQEILIQ